MRRTSWTNADARSTVAAGPSHSAGRPSANSAPQPHASSRDRDVGNGTAPGIEVDLPETLGQFAASGIGKGNVPLGIKGTAAHRRHRLIDHRSQVGADVDVKQAPNDQGALLTHCGYQSLPGKIAGGRLRQLVGLGHLQVGGRGPWPSHAALRGPREGFVPQDQLCAGKTLRGHPRMNRCINTLCCLDVTGIQHVLDARTGF